MCTNTAVGSRAPLAALVSARTAVGRHARRERVRRRKAAQLEEGKGESSRASTGRMYVSPRTASMGWPSGVLGPGARDALCV